MSAVVPKVLSEKGQSLLEVAMALGVIMIIISALAFVTISGLRNSEFAQNQTQATKLAEDAINSVRGVRDRNGLVIKSATNSTWYQYTWSSKTDSFILGIKDTNNSTTLSGWKCQPGPYPNPLPTTYTSDPCLSYAATPELINNKFSRTINIVSCDNDSSSSDCTSLLASDQKANKKVTVTVYWKDAGGQHQSSLVTTLHD